MKSIEGFQNKTRLVGLVRKIIKTEGYMALYAGFLANLARIVPNYAIIFLIYENMCHWFQLDKQWIVLWTVYGIEKTILGENIILFYVTAYQYLIY